jgi:hypothetical protein
MVIPTFPPSIAHASISMASFANLYVSNANGRLETGRSAKACPLAVIPNCLALPHAPSGNGTLTHYPVTTDQEGERKPAPIAPVRFVPHADMARPTRSPVGNRKQSDNGAVSPSALAVFRLITQNLVGCSTGRATAFSERPSGIVEIVDTADVKPKANLLVSSRHKVHSWLRFSSANLLRH